MSTEFLNQLFSVKCWEKFTPIYKLSIFDLDRVTYISTRRMKARELWRNFMFWNLENIVLWIWSERSSLTSSLGCPCKYSVFKYFVTSIWKKLINTSLYTKVFWWLLRMIMLFFYHKVTAYMYPWLWIIQFD